MKVILIGATGTIGTAVAALLEPDHEVIKVGNTRGDFKVDLGSKTSIEALYNDVENFDAVVSAAGQATFGSLRELTDEDFQLALNNKLLGQINLVRIGRAYIGNAGSFTLTTGALSQRPMPGSAAISTVNAGLEGFVRAAALELPKGMRVNAVSPIFVAETMLKMGMDPATGMSAAHTAIAYKASVDGKDTGQVLDVRAYS